MSNSFSIMAEFPHRALRLPEIISAILQQVDSPSNLARSARVCRQWCALALEELWKYNTPDLCDLESMHKAGNLSKYLPYIRHLDLHCNNCMKFRGMVIKQHVDLMKTSIFKLPRAVSLRVNLSVDLSKRTIYALCQPNLRSVQIFEGYYDNEVLEALQELCPDLESLEISNRSPEDVTTGCVLSFLNKMPSLRQICGILTNVDDSTLTCLAERPNLERVEVGGFESKDWIRCLLDPIRSQTPFGALQDLKIDGINATAGSVSRLLPMLQQLRRLELVVNRTRECGDIIAVLANCQKLKGVYIVINVPTQPRSVSGTTPALSTQSLLAFFRGCPNLRELTIMVFALAFECFEIPEEEYRLLIENLPNIESLSLPLECELGLPELRALQKCPRLHSLQTKHLTLNYYALQQCLDPPVLPSITTINAAVSDATGDNAIIAPAGPPLTAYAYLQVLRRLMPSLRPGRSMLPKFRA